MAIFPIYLAFAAARAVCLLLTPLVRTVALSWGLVDEPDGRRKMHARPIPIAGGVAVLLTVGVVLGGSFLWGGPWYEMVAGRWAMAVGLSTAAVVIAVVGIADDYRGMRGRTKLFWQLAAVIIVIASGVEVGGLRLFGHTITFDRTFAILFTAAWLLGAINSLNLIDGMDGLLGTLGCIICSALAAMAFMNGHYHVAAIAAAMAGALLGFLCFNFPPATIFLGDCGSMLIGLVVGVLAIQSSLKGPATVALTAPAALLIIPILDTSGAIVRRKLTGRSVFTTDRGHLHHVLLRRGMSNRGVLLLVSGLCVIASMAALFSLYINSDLLAALSALGVVGVLVTFRLFGHAEFLLIKEQFLSFFFALRHGHEQGRVHESAVRLQGSADWKDVWKQVTSTAEELQLRAVTLDVNAPAMHEAYHARWGRVPAEGETRSFWRAEIPLAVRGQIVGRIEVAGQYDGEPVGEKIAKASRVVEMVESALAGLTRPPAPFTLEGVKNSDQATLEDAPVA
ncbi:MAG TPA: MraY family glycosyltransferase [Gemmataceae bacterium]|jgi:UDP-GlcNAc:undecaprenyl-phosphate GlcNAc-1-phosphate transferase|nr:MraY family glycosyltransferase [Gemmataceae bacterium]